MLEKFIYFYDLNEKLLDRFPYKITELLKKKYGISKFVFLYSEKYEKPGFPSLISNEHPIYYLPTLSIKKIQKIITNHPPISLITCGMRLPDLLVLSLFNKKGVPTYMVQHGLFIEHLERIPLLKIIQQKVIKFSQYFLYSRTLSKILGAFFPKTLFELYLYFIKGSHKIPQLKLINKKEILATQAFIFDESWDLYYSNTYGYNKSQFIYIGNPDFILLKNILESTEEDAICYISQSLVEDGRYLKSDYLNFLDEFKTNLSGIKKVYIKLHPRSKIDLYDNLKHPNIEFTDDFPRCKYYFGHYSSLLAVANKVSSNVIIWELNGHKTPKEYIKYANLITSNWEEVKNYFSENTENIIDKDFITDLKSFNPFEKISDTIIKKHN